MCFVYAVVCCCVAAVALCLFCCECGLVNLVEAAVGAPVDTIRVKGPRSLTKGDDSRQAGRRAGMRVKSMGHECMLR